MECGSELGVSGSSGLLCGAESNLGSQTAADRNFVLSQQSLSIPEWTSFSQSSSQRPISNAQCCDPHAERLRSMRPMSRAGSFHPAVESFQRDVSIHPCAAPRSSPVQHLLGQLWDHRRNPAKAESPVSGASQSQLGINTHPGFFMLRTGENRKFSSAAGALRQRFSIFTRNGATSF
jgi:hypothetical protein